MFSQAKKQDKRTYKEIVNIKFVIIDTSFHKIVAISKYLMEVELLTVGGTNQSNPKLGKYIIKLFVKEFKFKKLLMILF